VAVPLNAGSTRPAERHIAVSPAFIVAAMEGHEQSVVDPDARMTVAITALP
jgi:hypothetical protein